MSTRGLTGVERYRARQRAAEEAAAKVRAARRALEESRRELVEAHRQASAARLDMVKDPALRLSRNTRRHRGHVLWTGPMNNRGLPVYKVKERGRRRTYSARQLAWSVWRGKSSTCCLMPTCGNDRCLSHLAEGRPVGVNRARTLTLEAVREIRAFVGPITREVAARWGVTPAACRDVRNRKTYRDEPAAPNVAAT